MVERQQEAVLKSKWKSMDFFWSVTGRITRIARKQDWSVCPMESLDREVGKQERGRSFMQNFAYHKDWESTITFSVW